MAIQAALEKLTAAHRSDKGADLAEAELNLTLLHTLQASTVGQILAALTVLGQRALADRDLHPERVALLHQLLDDWVALAEWILQRNELTPTLVH